MRATTIGFDSDGAVLVGTRTHPEAGRPHPAALILAGSGPLDRDGNHSKMQLNVSRDLAALLAREGWGSFRFDKRGVGRSSGDYLSTGFYDELADAEAALRWLADQPDVGPVVVVGHSVGAIYAGELASRHPELAGAVLLATSAKTGEETLVWQAAEMQDVLLPAPARVLLRLFRTDLVKQQAKALEKLRSTTDDVVRIQMVKTNAKWMREFMAHDPMPALGKVEVPVLAITGAKDVQVDAADLDRLAEVAADAEIHQFADLDHILRHEPAEISNPRHYGKQLSKPIDRRVIDALTAWLEGLAPQS